MNKQTAPETDKRPVIGVLPLYNSEKQIFWINPLYMRGIEEAGGTALLLTLTEDPALWEASLSLCDGLVFTGGQDVEPAEYGHDRIPECGYQAEMRDRQELYMMRRARELGMPVLGICRGIQVMNAAFGGTLYQHLPLQRPSNVIHLQAMPYDVPHHQVRIAPDSLLRRAAGREVLSVNSMHHQAVWDLAPDFRAVAWAEDGLIEAIELPEARFFLGVQWHPEHLFLRYQAQRGLWKALVNACRT